MPVSRVAAKLFDGVNFKLDFVVFFFLHLDSKEIK